jgi:glycosyltransferase involved in cell wall biosynthesis
VGQLHILGFDQRPDALDHRDLLERVSRGLGDTSDSVVLRRPGVPSAELGTGARISGAEEIPGITGSISPLLRLDHLPADADVLMGYGRTAGIADRLHTYAYPEAKVVQLVDSIPLDSKGQPDPGYVRLLGRADLVVTVGPEVTRQVHSILAGLESANRPPVHEISPVFEPQPLPDRIPGQGGFHLMVHDGDLAAMRHAADVVADLRARGLTDVRLTVTVRDVAPDVQVRLSRSLADRAGTDVAVELLPDDPRAVADRVSTADLVLMPTGDGHIDPAFQAAVERGIPVIVDERTGTGAFVSDALHDSGEVNLVRRAGPGLDVRAWADRVQIARADLAVERMHALDLRAQLTETHGPDTAARSLHDGMQGLDHVSRVADNTWRQELSPRDVVLRHAYQDARPPVDGQRTVLTTCTEYHSDKGGIPTANKELTESFGSQGARAFGLVSTVDSARPEVMSAEPAPGVHVFGTEHVWGVLDEKGRPDTRAMLLLPDQVPAHVDVVIGHSRFSGGAARWLVDHVYPDAEYVHVLHTSPEVLDGLKGEPDGPRHAQTERQLMAGADLVAGVGPLLGDDAARLAAEAVPHNPPPVHTIISDMPAKGGDPPARPADRVGYNLLVQGRAGDAIKGVDLAVKLAAQLHAEGMEVRLTVRGAEKGTAEQQAQLLRQIAGDRPGLVIDVREFTKDQTELLADLHEADLVLMPSVHEGFGLVASEAARAGKPVLVGEGTGAGRFFGDPEYVPAGLGEGAVVRDGNTLSALREALAAVTGPDGQVDGAAVRSVLENIDQRRLGSWLDRIRDTLSNLDPARPLALRDYLAAHYPPGNAARQLLEVLSGDAAVVRSPAATARTLADILRGDDATGLGGL